MSGQSIAAVTDQVDTLEKIALIDCARVLEKKLTVTDAQAMTALGYNIEPADDEGYWASRRVGTGEARVGTAPREPRCRVRFSGPGAPALYEALLKRLTERGLRLVGGARKPAEAYAVMDTLVRDAGTIAVVSMFRSGMPDSTEFAMTLYSLPPANRE